jgi:hypothetical protein
MLKTGPLIATKIKFSFRHGQIAGCKSDPRNIVKIHGFSERSLKRTGATPRD